MASGSADSGTWVAGQVLRHGQPANLAAAKGARLPKAAKACAAPGAALAVRGINVAMAAWTVVDATGSRAWKRAAKWRASRTAAFRLASFEAGIALIRYG
jgi:hypothetical protein